MKKLILLLLIEMIVRWPVGNWDYLSDLQKEQIYQDILDTYFEKNPDCEKVDVAIFYDPIEEELVFHLDCATPEKT